MEYSSTLAANYQYWQDHGDEWGAEYDRRKKTMLNYHIQELMLADYFTHSAPARVLEYGCGVGRHLRYLSKIPNLEVFGYDQSQTMVNNCLSWASQRWLDQHVTVGDPVARLPYPDKHFDFTFTAEVLVHICPSDLEQVLAELIRVSRWQILHMEPSPFMNVVLDAHNGCWLHDIVSAYRKLGHSCEILTPGYEIQWPYRVILDDKRQAFTWSPVFLSLLRQLERDTQPALNSVLEDRRKADELDVQLRTERAQVESLRSQLQAERTQVEGLRSQLQAEQVRADGLGSELQTEQAQVEALNRELQTVCARVGELSAELEGIRQTRSYRITQRLVRSHLGPWVVRMGCWLLPERGGLVRTLAGLKLRVPRHHNAQPDATTGSASLVAPAVILSDPTFSQAEREWIESMAQRSGLLSVGHPHWYGIRASATELFDTLYFINDTLDEAQGVHYARMFVEANCPAVVIQGFPLTYRYLVAALHRVAPRLPIYVIWHGGFVQSEEDIAWQGFRLIASFCREGKVAKWGFVKKGMAEIMAKSGYRTGFVMNMVREIPESPAIPLDGGPHLGIWGNWRKRPFAMLAATRMIDGADVHVMWGANERIREFAHELGLEAEINTQMITPERVPQVLAKMHLNLNVSLYECAPMQPLESLSVGVPCLLGPHSHYFEDQIYLHSRLVVPAPDRADVIAGYIEQALAERAQIIAAYREYAPGYNARARAALAEFLEIDEHDLWRGYNASLG